MFLAVHDDIWRVRMCVYTGSTLSMYACIWACRTLSQSFQSSEASVPSCIIVSQDEKYLSKRCGVHLMAIIAKEMISPPKELKNVWKCWQKKTCFKSCFIRKGFKKTNAFSGPKTTCNFGALKKVCRKETKKQKRQRPGSHLFNSNGTEMAAPWQWREEHPLPGRCRGTMGTPPWTKGNRLWNNDGHEDGRWPWRRISCFGRKFKLYQSLLWKPHIRDHKDLENWVYITCIYIYIYIPTI